MRVGGLSFALSGFLLSSGFGKVFGKRLGFYLNPLVMQPGNDFRQFKAALLPTVAISGFRRFSSCLMVLICSCVITIFILHIWADITAILYFAFKRSSGTLAHDFPQGSIVGYSSMQSLEYAPHISAYAVCRSYLAFAIAGGYCFDVLPLAGIAILSGNCHSVPQSH